MIKLPWKKPEVYEIAAMVVDGKKIEYNFTNPLTAERAQREFQTAYRHKASHRSRSSSSTEAALVGAIRKLPPAAP